MKTTRPFRVLGLLSGLGLAAGLVSELPGQPIFSWAQQGYSSWDQYGTGVATDTKGNVFVTGYFNYGINLGSTNLNSFGNYDAFVAKYNSAGMLLWVRQGGGGNSDYGRGVAVDPSGNCYVTGFYYGGMNLGATNLPGFGADDVFVAKYDTDGHLLWATAVVGGSTDQAYGIAVDAAGNALVTGYFVGTSTFGATTLVSSGGNS